MFSLNFHMFVVTLTGTYHVADHKPTSSSMNSQTDFLPSISQTSQTAGLVVGGVRRVIISVKALKLIRLTASTVCDSTSLSSFPTQIL